MPNLRGRVSENRMDHEESEFTCVGTMYTREQKDFMRMPQKVAPDASQTLRIGLNVGFLWLYAV